MIDTGKSIAIGILTICTNLVLMLVKLWAGVLGNSSALIADGIESAADILVSLITWSGFTLSLRPADDKHPFGHGKIEALTGVFSGAALIGAAGFITWQSIRELGNEQSTPAWFTLPVLLLVVVVKEGLSRYMLGLEEVSGSRAIEGDAWHHRSDALTSGAAAIGICIALVGGPAFAAADEWAALFACVIIVFNGIRIIDGALHEALDGAVAPELEAEVRQHANEIEGVANIEKCLIRKSGIGYFVEIHVEVPGQMTVSKGHAIGHDVKEHLIETMPNLFDVVVHLEPMER
ncbi:cation diffusion facilitator family transporter [Kiritimatiellaeota bacterium B1221]|nr:cation diffusion facilitator family transporter [Kiritimatiellaeota bacterium B1221]